MSSADTVVIGSTFEVEHADALEAGDDDLLQPGLLPLSTQRMEGQCRQGAGSQR